MDLDQIQCKDSCMYVQCGERSLYERDCPPYKSHVYVQVTSSLATVVIMRGEKGGSQGMLL